jgi:hypothetical protein
MTEIRRSWNVAVPPPPPERYFILNVVAPGFSPVNRYGAPTLPHNGYPATMFPKIDRASLAASVLAPDNATPTRDWVTVEFVIWELMNTNAIPDGPTSTVT